MAFLLGTDNVIEYLESQSIGGFQFIQPAQIRPKLCKNFNLIVEFSSGQSVLLKQEPGSAEGETKGELLNEWRVHQLLDRHHDLKPLQQLISHALAFDQNCSILMLRYFAHYDDLEAVYGDRSNYPPVIAQVLGATLAEIHRITLDRKDVKKFLTGDRFTHSADIPHFSQLLRPVTPEAFGSVTSDGLKFYELMQRYESLRQAIAQLTQHYEPCCLLHGDLKFSNLLLHQDWQASLTADGGQFFDPICEPIFDPKQLFDPKWLFDPKTFGEDAPIRIIDWEKWRWGDPAFDLGSLVADYLKRWLKSLMISPGLSIELALRLATTPLEQVQPSIAGLIRGYLRHFPAVLERFPDFLARVMRFAGLALIQSIQAHIHYYEPFGNAGICMLQVAKTLLCSPADSIPTVLGQQAAEVLV